MTWTDFIFKACQVPFVEKGRSWEGWDCWGLVYVAYRDVLGIIIPDYLDRYDHTHEVTRLSKVVEQEKQIVWKRVEHKDWARGDVMTIRRRNLCVHAGLIVADGQVMHAEQDMGTIIEPMPMLDIEGAYRIEGASPWATESV